MIGYQVDNEPGLQLLFNEGVFQRRVEVPGAHVDLVSGEVIDRELELGPWDVRVVTARRARVRESSDG